MELDEATRALLVDMRAVLLGAGSPALRIGKALTLLDGFTKVERGAFVAAAFRNGTPMYVGEATKWTKFHDLAKRFATRADAEGRLNEQMKTWQTKHLWKKMTLNDEELRAYQVMDAVK
jgi:hypothetical protein